VAPAVKEAAKWTRREAPEAPGEGMPPAAKKEANRTRGDDSRSGRDARNIDGPSRGWMSQSLAPEAVGQSKDGPGSEEGGESNSW
jgi:hypothetical protein